MSTCLRLVGRLPAKAGSHTIDAGRHTIKGGSSTIIAVIAVLLALALSGGVRAGAQDRFLGKQHILLYTFGLRVEPERQVVPKDIATIVSTYLQAPNTPPGDVPPFAPDAVVRATLRGPGAGSGIELTASPNTPFDIPPLSVPGIYTLEDIRLESGGDVLMRGVPESVTIEVIEKLLITQVTARALSAQEIREKGIVFDKSSFQAYDFTAAFAIQDVPVHIKFPVVLPSLEGAQDVSVSQVGLPVIVPPALHGLKTIIPDTLKLQTQIPNLQVVGFTLEVPPLAGKTLFVPPIPGVVVIPGDIGFLDQFFSVMLMVGNVAPAGSNLSVSDLMGSILLPPGNDTVAGSVDDPLRMAQTANGESPRIQTVAQLGIDGRLGTADDVTALGPGDSGTAEYLVEGRREGTHVIEFAIAGTLHGLPGGPVQVTGRAAGSVLVRNPTFTLTFTHPDTVAAGEPYTLDVTVTNTSESPANFVSVNLYPQHVSGAAIVGEPSRQIESIPAGDSGTVTFDLVARVTGKVTAATLDADDNIQGRFSLKSAVGELGVPVSPDSLVLPSQAKGLPANVRNAALGLLGKAWAVATAPAAALPPDVKRFSKQIVYDRAVEVAEAGFRITLQEPLPESVAQLAMDIIGSGVGRLAAKYPDPEALAFARRDFNGFDELRRRSVRGDVWAAVVADVLAPELAARGLAGFHRSFAEQMSYRPPHLSVLVGNAGGPLPYTISLVDSQGRRVGRADAQGKIVKDIPYSDVLPFTDGGATTAQMIVLAAPDAGEYHLQFDPVAGVAVDTPFDVTLVVPDASGRGRQIVYRTVTGGATPVSPFAPADPYRVLLDLPVPGAMPAGGVAPASNAAIVAPTPRVISAIQQANADLLSCGIGGEFTGADGGVFHVGLQAGRVIALLFSEEVTASSVQDRLAASDITNYGVDENAVVGVALQPGGRIVYLALRDPVGPFVSRTITISGAAGVGGGVMLSQTLPIQATVTDPGTVVTGQVLNADGTPVPFANVRLLINPCVVSRPGAPGMKGVSSKSTDAQGRFAWDFVVDAPTARIIAVDPATDESRSVDFSGQRDGQRLNVNIVLLGRGTLKGRTLTETGTPVAGAQVRVTSLTDHNQFAATTDAQGTFTIARVPVGHVFIEAVNVKADAQGHLLANRRGTASELIPLAGAVTIRDITLFDFMAPDITVKFGTLTGHVLRADGASPVADAPVIAYYVNQSQPGVSCPGIAPADCPVGLERTDADGAFTMANLSAGQYRLVTFDQPTFQEGEARVAVPADGTGRVNILLARGIGTVQGTVLDGNGAPVANARVGGGLSLTTTDAAGQFTLNDVPVGNREIVAVSDALGTKGKAIIDIVQAGQIVNVSIVLEATASIAGSVLRMDGATPVPNNKVYVFHTEGEDIRVVATATTDVNGHYSVEKLPLRTDYTISSFLPNFSDGNIKRVALKFINQVVRGDIVFRGGASGHVTGAVFDADGTTPLRAAVGISGDQPVIAVGGLVGVGFQTVTNFAVTQTDFATGQFRFDNVWVGPFTLAAVGQFSPDPITFESAIPSPGATVNVTLRLQPTSRISGTVFQPDGVTPAGPNLLVRYKSNAYKVVCPSDAPLTIGSDTVLVGQCADIPQGIQEETVITDGEGRYLLPLVNAGPFTLTVEDAATGKIAQANGAVKPGQTGELSIRLLGMSALTINVRGSDSTTPIPGARIEVSQIAFPKKTITSIADATGMLILDGGDAFSEGDLIVMATDLRNGFAGRASARVTRDGDTVTINVFLYNQSGTVFGTVFKADGLTPVANADVVISNDRGPLAFAVSDANGQYRQELIPLGEVRVDVFEAATARRGFATGRIDLDHQQVPINVAEAARGLVTGTVIDLTTLGPIKNAEVRLEQSAPGGRSLPPLYTTSEVDGTFSFPGVTVGPIRIVVSKAAFLPDDPFGFGTATATLIGDGERVDVPMLIRLQRKEFGRVEGTVVNANGTPAANVSVEVCVTVCGVLGAVTAADGTFSVDRVPVNRFFVRAQSQVTPNASHQYAELLFEGDTTRVTLTLIGVSQISGNVVFSDGRTAPNASVTLFASPSSGCQNALGTCTIFTDSNGDFAFINVPARTFTVIAADAVSGLRGIAAGALDPGDSEVVRLVLEPTASATGRVLFSNGNPAVGVTVDLLLAGSSPAKHFFAVSDSAGQFSLQVLPIGTYAASFEDPLGPGVAFRTIVANTSVALGDVVLDDAAPSVASVTPAASAVGVARNSAVQIVFSEPVDAGTINQTNVSLIGPAGSVSGTMQLSNGDTTVTITPIAPLADQTRYSLTVSGVKDRLGKKMTSSFTSSFTTVDITAPSAIDLSPGTGASGVPITSAIRIKFSEPIDVAQFGGPPLVMRKGGTPIDGRVDYILGNTTVVFTPLVPLDDDSLYQVQTLPAADLYGNTQGQGLTYSFSTTDRTPPVIQALVPGGNGTVIENAVGQITANVGTSHDVAVVDFFINDQPTLAARTAPFTLAFQATQALGQPGDQIKISALATDTSGNRSAVPQVVFVGIVADQPAVVTITSPAEGLTARNGDRVDVVVRTTDDLGVTQVGYRAQTGRPQDAATRPVAPASVDRTETFAFSIPGDAAPGSTVVVRASAVDTKGQVSDAAPIHVVVLDATPPSITITGTTTGAKVSPGQQTSAVISAQDLGGITSITFATGGVLVSSQTRQVNPLQNSVATSFSFTIPATAHAGDVLTLDATATDAAGNTASAARVLLPVADLNPPTIQLRTSSGSLDIVPGNTVTVIAQTEDETAVASVALIGQGAFNVSDAKQISPPSNSAQTLFQIAVPEGAAIGSTLNLSAIAADVFANASAPATLSLTIKSVSDVVLPPSLLLSAGEAVPVVVQLSSPAPAGGLRVDLSSSNGAVAEVSASVQFAAGEISRTATVSGVKGGVISLSASIGGVLRTSMTVTVRGGVITGTVLNPDLEPVAGVQVSITSAGLTLTTTSDASGSFTVAGVGGGFSAAFTIRAHDQVSGLMANVSGAMNVANGFARVTLVLLSAGSIGGTVLRPDGETPVGEGARVDIFAVNDLQNPLGATFTDENGTYEFPLVSLGAYTIEATDTNGNRGRSFSIVLNESGQHVDAPVTYLGRGTVAGRVLDGSGKPKPNVPITFNSASLFGQAQPIATSSLSDGTFRFESVFVGSFTIQAHDPVTNLSGSGSGTLVQDQQVVSVDVTLGMWGGLQGTVRRADGVTPAPNAEVTLSVSSATASGAFFTTTDTQGQYSFTFVPLGNYVLLVREVGTRGLGRATGVLSVQAQVVTRDVTLFPQGSVLVMVTDAAGGPVSGARVTVGSNNGQASDSLDGTTGSDGTALIERVLVGNISVSVYSNGLSGSAQTTLGAGEIRAITVALQPTASITGTVYLPDGQTPATAGSVALCQNCLRTSLAADGTYRFDNLGLHTFTVLAFDAQGRRRATAKSVRLETNGQVVNADLTFVGLGTVTGRVLNPDNSSAPNIVVTVKSLDPEFGGFAQPRTDAAGFYRAENVVVGNIAVNAGDVTQGLLGEATGTLAADGGTVTIDILLKNNAVNLPVLRHDGNFFPWDIQKNASPALGYNSVFGPPFNGTPFGGLLLDLIVAGTPNRFTGANIGTTEAGGREIVVTQTGLAGLSVTRKAFVSPTYFARYLELITNSTASPITLDVRVQSVTRAHSVAATSSGDSVPSTTDATNPDRWVTLAVDNDVDPFSVSNVNLRSQLGFVFDGAGAAARVSNTSFAMNPTNSGVLSYTWSGVAIQPGETVALLHFGVQQYSRAAAQASVERLVQLPPEAFDSLSPTEIAAIRNFVLPADGTSTVAPLPRLDGTVTGTVFEADGTTPVPSTTTGSGYNLALVYRSSNILFGRTYTSGANLAGRFSFGPTGDLIGFLGPVTVPVEPFTLSARHFWTQVQSPSTVGSFEAGSTIATTDLIYSNTAVVKGFVRRHTGAIVPDALISSVFSSQGSNFGASYFNSKTDGSFVAGGILPSTAVVTARLRHPQGLSTVNLTGTISVTVVAGQTLTHDITLQPTGALSGTVRNALGAPAVNVSVDMFGLKTTTDSAGVYRFTDVPVGTFNVQATDPVTQFVSAAPATIVQDQTQTVDLRFVPVGSVQVTATYTNGQPAVNARIDIQKPQASSAFQFAGNTDASGRVTIPSVPGGASFIVRVYRPAGVENVPAVDVTGTVTTQGEIVPVAAVVTPVGSVLVQVNTIDGTPVPNARVDSDYASQGQFFSNLQADVNGSVTLTNVPGGRVFRVRGFDSTTGQYREVSGQITGEAQSLPLTIVVGTVGSLSGHVVHADGTPAVAQQVLVRTDSPPTSLTATTDASGAYSLTGVPVGDVRARVAATSQQVAGSTSGRVEQHDESVVADIVLTDVTLPTTPLDANGYLYRINANGNLGQAGNAEGYLSSFTLITGQNGSLNTPFGGDFAASPDSDGRQLTIRDFQNGNRATPQTVVGTPVNVTRKVYVPASGYFARFLEILENPSPNPVLVDLQIAGTLTATRIVTTSSADAVVQTSDRWMVADRPATPTTPAVAHVFQGAAPPAVATIAQTSPDTTGRIRPNLQWRSVLVPANGRAMVMHFTSQEPDAAAAQAAAERLVQLPPEALVGLTPEDAAAIVNFAVPSDVSSPVAAFASATGRVLASDGVTPAKARVSVTGNSSPIFKSTVTVPTNTAGQYTASTLVPGPVTLQAVDPLTGVTSATAALTLPAGQASVTRDLVFATSGILSGTVRLPSGALAVAAQIAVTGGAAPVAPPVGTDGRYAVMSMPPGTYMVSATLAGRVPATRSGVVVTANQNTTADLRFGALVSLRVTARKSNGSPITGARVVVTDSVLAHPAGVTNATGLAIVPSVVEGAYSVRVLAPDNVTLIGTAAGTIAPGDDGATFDITVQTTAGNISGTLYAADGETLLSNGATVEVFDIDSNTLISSASANALGQYDVPSVTVPGASGFRIVARSQVNASATAQANGFVGPGESVAVNMALPVSVVKGTVTLSDGVTPTFAVVFVSQEGADGRIVQRFALADQSGRYSFVGLGAGAFEVVATQSFFESSSLLEATVAGTLDTAGSFVTADVRLPPAGTVTGEVFDAEGNRVEYAEVALSSDGTGIFRDLTQTTDDDPDDPGRYTFTGVPAGRFTVQACGYLSSDAYLCGSATASLSSHGQAVTLNVVLRPQGGSVSGRLFAADGVTPLEDELVELKAGEDGPLATDRQDTYTDENGEFEFDDVPAGPLTIAAPERAAIAIANNTAGPVTVDLVEGSAATCESTLSGTNGFRYDVKCSGELGTGGTIDGRLSKAYASQAYSLRVNGVTTTGEIAARRDMSGRQLVYGPMSLSGVVATRRIYVPDAGTFARYLETITNPSAQPVTIDVQIEAALDGAVHALVDPTATNGTYAVTRATATIGTPTVVRPTLAHVFGGPGATVPASAVRFQGLTGTSFYRWRVTIPGGGTVSLMHFAVQRDETDAAGAESQAQGLSDLADPNALAGMSPADKARVVNFRIE